MFHSSRLRALLLSMAAAALIFACSASNSEYSWLDGSWTADPEVMLDQMFPKLPPGLSKADLLADADKLRLDLVVDTAARTVRMKGPNEEARLTITDFIPQDDGAVRMDTRNEQSGAVNSAIWKRLPNGSLEMRRADGKRYVFHKK